MTFNGTRTNARIAKAQRTRHLVGTVEILACQRALPEGGWNRSPNAKKYKDLTKHAMKQKMTTYEARPCHVAADDEMRGSKVFSDDHMLDGFSRPGHFHGVGKVRPPEVVTCPLLVLGLLLQHFIRLDAGWPVDVARLGWSASGMHKDNRILNVLVGMNLKDTPQATCLNKCTGMANDKQLHLMLGKRAASNSKCAL